MDPSQTLILLLITGAVGSALLTWLFFFLVSRFLDCPVCRGSKSMRHAYCISCGKPVSAQHLPDARHDAPAVESPPLTGLLQSGQGDVRRLYDALCRLSPQDRAGLNALMQQHVAGTRTDGDPTAGGE